MKKISNSSFGEVVTYGFVKLPDKIYDSSSFSGAIIINGDSGIAPSFEGTREISQEQIKNWKLQKLYHPMEQHINLHYRIQNGL